MMIVDDLQSRYFDLAQPSTSSQAQHKSSGMTKAQVRQVVAMAVISRLQEWCLQLFWITVLCVMGCCSEENKEKSGQEADASGRPHRRHNLAELEQKMLRHLTSPLLSNLRPVVRSSKRRPASRPPSPQLFDIQEELED